MENKNENEKNIYYNDEDEEIIKPPYWRVEYIDDYGYKHLASIINEDYLKYLQDNHCVIDVRLITS